MQKIDTQGGIYFYEWKSEKQDKGSFNYSIQDVFYHKDPNRDFFIYDHDNKKWKFIAGVEVPSTVKAVLRNDVNINDFLFKSYQICRCSKKIVYRELVILAAPSISTCAFVKKIRIY